MLAEVLDQEAISYELRVKIVGSEPTESEVRAWIDRNLAGDLATEEELPLRRDEDGAWLGEFDLSDNCDPGFAYRIGVVAESGAVWSLSIGQRGNAESILLEDSDVLTERKHWLLGTC
jgi:hypothetical protein